MKLSGTPVRGSVEKVTRKFNQFASGVRTMNDSLWLSLKRE